jgi:hypothetical protein
MAFRRCGARSPHSAPRSCRTERTLLGASVVIALVMMAWYWPPIAGFWHEEVWEMGKTDPQAAAIAEQAREGMGMMIATVAVVAVALWSFARRAEPRLRTS